jgi:hypothetical protein
VSVCAAHGTAEGFEPVPVLSTAEAEPGEVTMARRRSVLPSRRAVLHVQATGDRDVPPDLVSWFTERAFHFYYLAGVRLPGQRAAGRGRHLGQAFADLDAACRRLRETEGMDHIIVSGQDSGATAAALWTDRPDPPAAPADALVLVGPAFGARPRMQLNIACPVLVLTDQPEARAGDQRGWRRRPRRPEPAPPRLGSHVTWLQLPDQSAGSADGAGRGRQPFFDELGRWLGAYMYGMRDQLL